MRDTLRQPPRVHEQERRPMSVHQIDDAVVNLAPHFIRSDRAELGRGNLDGQIDLALVADVDDYRFRPVPVLVRVAGEEARNFSDRFLRRGKTDTNGREMSESFQAFE